MIRGKEFVWEVKNHYELSFLLFILEGSVVILVGSNMNVLVFWEGDIDLLSYTILNLSDGGILLNTVCIDSI